jgi:hypothetical protein
VPNVPFGKDVVVIAKSVTLIERAFELLRGGVELSLRPTVKLNVPPVVGVPLITPAPESVRPGGNVPEARDHVNGVTPGLAASVCEYAAPTAALGKAFVVISGGTAIEKTSVSDCAGLPLSTARTVNENLPVFVGVPEIVPLGLKLRPGGRDPPVRLQVTDPVPPLELRNCWGYGELKVPFGNAPAGAGVITRGSATTIVKRRSAFWGVALLSVTLTTKSYLPAVPAPGVPLMVPSVDNAMPVGSPPEMTRKLYGGVPPVAVKVRDG